MKLDLSGTELFLPAGRLLRLECARGKRIVCTAGILWITVAGNSEDVFLRAGECYDIPTHGLVLVEGLENSQLALPVQVGRSASWGRRTRLALQ